MILNLLDEHEMDPFLYAGDFVNGKHAVVNDPNSKWYKDDKKKKKSKHQHRLFSDFFFLQKIFLGI